MLKITNKVSQLFSLVSQKISARLEYISKLKVVSLKPQTSSVGNVLLSYRIEPFLLQAAGKPIPNDQSWNWECLIIAQTFLDMGYSVDVIQFHNEEFRPTKKYDFFIDIRHRIESLAPYLNPDCIKILHVDIANMVFRNLAEYKRLHDLQQRRGITLHPQRYEDINLGIEYADYATVLGNDFTCGTFAYSHKPMYRIPISSSVVCPWAEDKNFEAVKKRFLWFGSNALVLKGLDLALEAFAQMPDYHLTVCGPVNSDKVFERAYHKELYETPNIHVHGWIDVGSQEFLDLTKNTLALIYPSACEGQAGAAITAMQAGLIPVLSYETGANVYDFGVILKDCSIENIKAAIEFVSNQPTEELKTMSRKAWEYARNNHTKECFAVAYRNAVLDIIKNRSTTEKTTNVDKQLASAIAG
ncbi:glycosyl transferase family 1 [Calothrix sp. HK-06]|nr:glycosyl transferase family 1 [Calothrix sp. HK-06]